MSFNLELFSESKKKKNSKKSNTVQDKNSPSGKFSKELNKFSTMYWLDESTNFNLETLSYLSEAIPEENEIATNPNPTQEKSEEKSSSNEEKQKTDPTKPNALLTFISEYKKILLIIGIILLFAIYRIRNASPPKTTHSGRIFSKFKDK
jgi:Sec region non-globular protein